MTLNTDFSAKGMASDQIAAVVSAWQAGAISQETMLELFRKGEVLPAGRSNEEEVRLLGERTNGGEIASRQDAKTPTQLAGTSNIEQPGAHGVTRPTAGEMKNEELKFAAVAARPALPKKLWH